MTLLRSSRGLAHLRQRKSTIIKPEYTQARIYAKVPHCTPATVVPTYATVGATFAASAM